MIRENVFATMISYKVFAVSVERPREELMDDVGRARARSRSELAGWVLDFRYDPMFDEAIGRVCEMLFVARNQVYVLDVIPDQLEYTVSVFVWPTAVVSFEVPYDGSPSQGHVAMNINEFMRGRRGSSRRRFELVREIASGEWGNA